MKKWIVPLVFVLLLTGSIRPIGLDKNPQAVRAEVIDPWVEVRKTLVLDEEMRAVIREINLVKGKYKDYIDEHGYDSLFIDIYDGEYRNLRDIDFNNRHIHIEEYFYDLVDVLDRTIAQGLKDYVLQAEGLELSYDEAGRPEVMVERIGRTVVYVEDRHDDKNWISISIDLLDIEDDYYRQAFDDITAGKYILKNFIFGEEWNLIDFVNAKQAYYYDRGIKIRYNMFFKDKDMAKANILMKGKSGEEFEDSDMDVFLGLLNSLDLDEEEKGLLIEEYRSVFEGKINSRKLDMNKYEVYINDKKGNFNRRDDLKMVYFSIRKK